MHYRLVLDFVLRAVESFLRVHSLFYSDERVICPQMRLFNRL